MLDKLVMYLENDPIYFIVAVIIICAASYIYAKTIFERVLDGIMDHLTDTSLPEDKRADQVIEIISSGMDTAISKVKKRKKLISFIKKILTSGSAKSYFIKVMKKYPNVVKLETQIEDSTKKESQD